MRPFCRLVILVAIVLFCGASPSVADPVSFKGKTITFIVGTSTGGTTDFSTRLIAEFLTKYLPGTPSVVVQNRPGAHALAALSYFAQQAKPDGLTVAGASITELDPKNYHLPQSRYDPSTFAMIGGVDIGGGIMIVRKEVLPRLMEKSLEPVAMGSVNGYPHVTMLMAAWGINYLGWNVKWVPGYPSQTAALVLALERGEIDMTGFSATGLSPTLLDKSKYAILYQTGSNAGTVPSPLVNISVTPLFATAMNGKSLDPVAQKAFEFWVKSGSVVDWVALPPGTPTAIVDTYRAAYSKVSADPEFMARGKTFSQDFTLESLDKLMDTIHVFAQEPPDVLDFMPQMLRKQGLNVD